VIAAGDIVNLESTTACYLVAIVIEGGAVMNRRHLLGALALSAAASLGTTALAMDRKFDQKAFEAAQAAGQPILIEVTAPWCPVCKAQAPILSKLKSDARFKSLASFSIDFDSQKELLKRFNVQKQSTLIVFKGRQEAGRSTGDTNAGSIEQLLAKSI
jgi:thiol-disulfide isomerase/thioredoxin